MLQLQHQTLESMEKAKKHVMLVTFSAQGLINPLLQLAKIFTSRGFLVTFAATQTTSKRMSQAQTKAPTDSLLRFEFFDDGWDLIPQTSNMDTFIQQLTRIGPSSLTKLIENLYSQGRPVSCIVGNPFLPWVADVAEQNRTPYVLLWTQPFLVFAIYYYHFCNSNLVLGTRTAVENYDDFVVELPGLPTLRIEDLPTFLLPWNPYRGLSTSLLETFRRVKKATCILVNSFDELESQVTESIKDLQPVKLVGPLVPRLSSNKAVDNVRGDMWKAADCLQWLDTQPASSVVYISFGSYVVHSEKQMEEVAQGIRSSGKQFLLVGKKPDFDHFGVWGLPEGFMEEIVGQGKVVDWCPQFEVLCHPSIACFLTHCGWNSTLETIVAGVPVVAFPNRGDQMTNAKMLVEVYGMGIQVRSNADGIVEREEIRRCIAEVACGVRAMELKENASKWKEAAQRAMSKGGSSTRNIEWVVDELIKL